MKLSSALSSLFDGSVRARGATYFRSKSVRIERGSEFEVEAKVRGGRIYDVGIHWDGRELSLFCDCPYFDSGGPCKHLWATVLAADEKDYIGGITKFNPRSVHLDRNAGAYEDQDFEEEEIDGEEQHDPFAGLIDFDPPPKARRDERYSLIEPSKVRELPRPPLSPPRWNV